MKSISANPFDEAIIRGVTEFLYLANRAKSADMTISISKDAVPTVSYNFDELPIIPKGETDERS